ncbi:molecular chaperone [Pseudoalteromonas sp. SSM20]|uniref:molecular chaperone n=1 Tax=Pseudoalteromonas sp. SSM20 TaxID=3139394 RepID=UPI003BAC7D10
MIVGFDYGSSNCAMGVMDESSPKLIPLEQGKPYLPSTLYAQHNSLIVDYVAKNLSKNAEHEHYLASRKGLLSGIPSIRADLDLASHESGIYIGKEAIEEYIEFPEEGFYVKSPKSFFGATGLKTEQIAFFEDIATAMIMAIKKRAESHLGRELLQTVIGRPVNFQAVGGEESNQQAVEILTKAAKRAGFKDVEFLYEPLAAGIDFETSLNQDKKVLVVDIGGGTSDCSFVQMGPSFRDKHDRSNDFLSHSGKRIGGNDLDIALSFHKLMPQFGLGTQMKSGLPMPHPLYWQACKINDIHLQSEFYSDANHRELTRLLREVEQPNLLARLIKVLENKQSHQLVRQGELAKIALSEDTEHTADLSFIESCLKQSIVSNDLSDAINESLKQMVNLANDAITSAATRPDVIYLTGGSAQSPLLKKALQHALGDIPMLNGDNFGSVTAGLTKWAHKLYK